MTELEGIQYLEFLLRLLRVVILLGVLKISVDLKRLCGKWEVKG